MLEYNKNSDIIKVILKMKDTEKKISSLTNNLRALKVPCASLPKYRECLDLYFEGSCYYFECIGFLKSQYFCYSVSPHSKKFLIKNLFNPACKKFLNINQILSAIQVEENYKSSVKVLKEKIDLINLSLFELQKELNRME